MDEEKFKNILEEEIEKLAIVVGKGFEEVHKKMATKEDITDIHGRLDGMDNRLVKIENMHEQRLERVEDRVQILEKEVDVH